MKKLTIILLLAASGLMAQINKEQKYFRVVEIFKTEDRKIYFNWSLDSVETYKTKNNMAAYGKGAILQVESKFMTPKEAEKANKRNENKKKRANYPNIKDIN